MIDDIITVFAQLVVGMRRLGLKAPEALVLRSNEDGMRLLGELMLRTHFQLTAGEYGKPVEHPDGSVWMEVECYGLKIRWPARKHALPSGGYKWQ